MNPRNTSRPVGRVAPITATRGPLSRVLLVAPDSGASHNLPPLSLLYLAASLRRAGIEVRIADLDNPHEHLDTNALPGVVAAFEPQVVGISLCSETALEGYRLAEALASCEGILRVAGGPHATALPLEPLEHGFDLVVRGEGEATLLELCQLPATREGLGGIGVVTSEDRGGVGVVTSEDRGGVGDVASEDRWGVGSVTSEDPGEVGGVTFRDPQGTIRSTADRPRISPLDSLASPVDVLDLLARPDFIGTRSGLDVIPTILSSRGCPGRCAFCANQVHGHKVRCHSSQRVLFEIESWHRVTGNAQFNFCDAAFTADRDRVMELCLTMERLSFSPSWWCEVRADQVDATIARALAGAGCRTILLGAESGDMDVLRRVGKAIPLERTRSSLAVAKEAGLSTEVSFMLGFPDETAEELDRTLRFMESLSDVVDWFRPLGLVVPYPGTRVYERHHERLGFTRWWLCPSRNEIIRDAERTIAPSPDPRSMVASHAVVEEAFLAAHPIPYSSEVQSAIRRCMAFRREHNLRSILRWTPSVATSDS